MPTLMIRLEYPPPGDQLVVRGFTIRHGERGWHEDVGPVKEIARDLPTMATRLGDRSLDDLARSVLVTPAASALTPTEVGRALWSVITDGEVGAWWAGQLGAAQGPIRTILDIQPPDLRALPWELMTPPHGAPVFRDAINPWVRAKPNWPPLDELAVPVQILVVIGQVDSPELKVDDELEAIHRCVREKPGSWHIQTLVAPSTAAVFRETYEAFDPHILHIVGHTAVHNGQYALRMVPPGAAPWPLTVEDVAELPIPAPRLVVLNCCRTAQAGAVAEPAWSFSEAFLDRGSAAVVTMQGDIPSAASVGFTARFYRELVAGNAIDAAAARARLAVNDVLQDRRSWALPSLVVTTDPDRVLPVRESLSPAELNNSPYAEVFGAVPDYVDRNTERRMVLKELNSDRDGSRVLLLKGPRQYGRSAVLRSALLTLRLQGRNTVYVDLDSARRAAGRKLSWLSVLRLIRDAIWTWLPDLPDGSRQRFDHELSYLLEHRDPGAWAEGAGRPDPGQEFPSEGEDYAEWINRIVVAFRRMLVAAAAERPLLLALDSLRAIHDEDLRDVLAEQLLLPLITGRARDGLDADVRFVTTASADELTVIPDQYRRPLERGNIEIKPFQREDITRLVGEYVARHNLMPSAAWRERVEGMLRDGSDEVLKPGTFTSFLEQAANLLS